MHFSFVNMHAQGSQSDFLKKLMARSSGFDPFPLHFQGQPSALGTSIRTKSFIRTKQIFPPYTDDRYGIPW